MTSSERTLTLINGVLAGLGGVFLLTGSVPVTAIAAAAAVLIAVGSALIGRRAAPTDAP
ncbi:hypothetical protein OWR29_13895 [Actinoplanes sp. Pm04-4]|uniref:Uncharacterized protein n=1 Tax=Paractinoplanes pyxinae TaxID=2997416 RepID=A0ABT4AXZ0_9ACTN|nr:hypothetical protein [Actinoplanes pyxinae]MCY1139085.1 hypothetical protein [Actinoplanes pyxinae]